MSKILKTLEKSLSNEIRELTISMYETDDEQRLNDLVAQKRDLELQLSNLRLELYSNKPEPVGGYYDDRY